MSGLSRRLAQIEEREAERIIAEMRGLPEREWFSRGYIPVDRLPEAERVEFWALAERLFDESGRIAYGDALTSDEYQRLRELAIRAVYLNRPST